MKIDKLLLDKIKRLSESNRAANGAFFSKLKRLRPKNLDKTVADLHDELFETTDCLECANCCKTLSPALYEADIERLARNLKMKVPVFKDTYIAVDEDGDYIFKTTPCPFLGEDHYCFVYTDRPKACREYPHTDRKRFHQILKITEKNMAVCPVVFGIIEKIKKEF